MAAGAHEEWAPSGVLRWAFAAAILLGVLVTTVSTVEIQRARREVDALVRTAHRSSLLVGEVSRHLARLRAKALDRLLIPGHEQAGVDDRAAAIATVLEERLRELDAVLLPEERVSWTHFYPLVETYRRRLADAMDALRRGDRDRARVILVHDVTPLGIRMQDQLDVLTAQNEAHGQALLAAADQRLARVRLLEIGLGTALAGCLGLIWWTALGALAVQRRRLAEYVARIEGSNRDLDAFAGRVAHDLRNALGPLGLIAAGLREARERPEIVVRFAGQLRESVRRSQKLIDGLLAFSRPRGAEPPTWSPLRRIVDEVVEDLAPVAARLAARVEVDVPPLEVQCAASLLQVVIANVVGNALKYMEGRPERRVRVAACATGDGWCELTVEDTGPGIPDAARARVFEPFYRAPGTAAPGTGIGLATVRRIVEGSGGTVRLDSVVGRGSVFRLRLPARAASVETSESDARQPAG